MRADKAINIEDLRRLAKRRLPKIIFDFIEGGAEDERGLVHNQEGSPATASGRDISSMPRNAISR